MSDYIPDPIELIEIRGELMAERYIRGDEYICCDCGKRGPLSEANPAGPHPSSPPICWDCLEKHYTQNGEQA